MAVSAFIFIECAQGKPLAVCRAVSRVEGIKMASAVTGPYDVVALGEAADINALGRLVVGKIQKIQGVLRPTTSVCIE